MSRNKKSNILQSVQKQYQVYPYPLRDPSQERERLIALIGSSLSEINHWLFRGKETFTNRFRVLVAGGGTGDASTFLALQLLQSNAEIVYLDFSEASLEIAKKRAEVRGLTNIRFVCDDLMNLPNLKLGKFDYIDCTGVLHHLQSPLEGLKILKNALTDQGGINLMVYGKYGRTGIYQVQELLRRVNEGVTEIEEEMRQGKKILQSLPQNHWFLHSPSVLLEEARQDEGFYDLCLHKQDRSYSIPELYQLLQDAGLHFVTFCEPLARVMLQPETYIQDAALLQKIKALSLPKQQAIAELLAGHIFKHSVYVSKNKQSEASFSDLDQVPSFYAQWDLLETVKSVLSNEEFRKEYKTLSISLNSDSVNHYTLEIPVSSYTKYLFQEIDEKKSLKEIFAAIRAAVQKDIPDTALIEEAKKVLEPFILPGLLLLRDKSISPFMKWL